MSVFDVVSSIFLMFSLAKFIQAKDGCKLQLYLNCTQNKTLAGHVIDTINVTSDAAKQTCRVKCFIKDQCVSYNLGPVEGGIKTCELSSADHWMRPGFLVFKQGYEYCPIQNPCSSSPCPSQRLCTPDFAWDTYSCDDGGWTQWGPWSSCFNHLCPRIRKRNCTNPAPQNKGKTCTGSDTDRKKCNIYKIPEREDCSKPLGMESRSIENSQITASSDYGSRYAPYMARLNNQATATSSGSWSAKTRAIDEWLQVDLLNETIITKVATQGRPSAHSQWITKYALAFSNDNKFWTGDECFQNYQGNSDQNTIVTNTLESPIKARYIRLIVKGFYTHPSTRMELYGCSP